MLVLDNLQRKIITLLYECDVAPCGHNWRGWLTMIRKAGHLSMRVLGWEPSSVGETGALG